MGTRHQSLHSYQDISFSNDPLPWCHSFAKDLPDYKLDPDFYFRRIYLVVLLFSRQYFFISFVHFNDLWPPLDSFCTRLSLVWVDLPCPPSTTISALYVRLSVPSQSNEPRNSRDSLIREDILWTLSPLGKILGLVHRVSFTGKSFSLNHSLKFY